MAVSSRQKMIALAVGVCVLLTGLMVMSGCAAKNPHPAGTFDRAAFYAEQGQEVEAVSAFESFIRQNPTDSLAAEAQYQKGMAYMAMEEFPLAAVEFQILRKDYPNSPLVEDALFQEGVAYLNQVGRIERDITGAYEARLHFLKFMQEYPNSKYMPQVSGYMAEISDLMVRKRLEQIKVYQQLRRYEAVAITLDDVLIEEAGSSLIPEVMWDRASVAKRLDDPDTAARMYERLITDFPDTKYGKRAGKALKSLDGDEDEDEEEDY